MPKVSVLMCAYNSELYVKKSIESIYNQSFKNWEIIFIDDASTDNTSKIAKSFDSNLKYIKFNDNKGNGYGRKKGIEYCNGEYIAFLDSDDIWEHDFLENQIKSLNSTDFAFSYSGYNKIDNIGNIIGEVFPEYEEGFIFQDLLKRYEILLSTVLLRKSVLTKENINFSENILYANDYHLFMDIAINYKITNIKKKLVKYRVRENSLSQTFSIKEKLSDLINSIDFLELKFPFIRQKFPDELLKLRLKIEKSIFDNKMYL